MERRTFFTSARTCSIAPCSSATWGTSGGPIPSADYWPTVIADIRRTHPDFLFLAEAYWEVEWSLLQQAFDYCYDKRLYDRLVEGNAEQVRRHLWADEAYQTGMVRFVENHDEPRAASTFTTAQAGAAAVTALTQTGARLVHHGQLEGRPVRLPVFLGRYPDESVDDVLVRFYRSLLTGLTDPTFRHGRWQLCDCSGWPDNDSYQDLVAWCWSGTSRSLIVVNLGERAATGRVHTPWPDLAGSSWQLTDPTRGENFQRAGDDLVEGLFVALDPWHWHLFRIDQAAESIGNQ